MKMIIALALGLASIAPAYAGVYAKGALVQGVTNAAEYPTTSDGMKLAVLTLSPNKTLYPALKTALGKLGVVIQIANDGLGQWQVKVPPAVLSTLPDLPGVGFMRPVRVPVFHTGSVMTQGDAVMHSDTLRKNGITGHDVKIGVMSDGMFAVTGPQATGDLPSSIVKYHACDKAVTHTTCAEGTAMLEIVNDIAPDSELAFCAVSTTLGMVDCYDKLVNDFHADVIVDDVGFFSEPMFADGEVAKAAAKAANSAIVLTAAGNSNGTFYEATYAATHGLPEHNNEYESEHNFAAAIGGNDPTQDISLEPGESATFILQWDEPWGTANVDYDLALYAKGHYQIPIALSNDVQDGQPAKKGGPPDDFPVEGVSVKNTSESPQLVELVIYRFTRGNAVPQSRRLKLFWQSGPAHGLEYESKEGSIVGHAAVPSVLAIAAVPAGTPMGIEPFSSTGPYIAHEGLTIPKPDLTAPDGVAVTGAGGFATPFFGTSAAAPHAAAVAALLLQLDKQLHGDADRDTVISALRGGAVDLGEARFDPVYGYGRIDAVKSAGVLSGAPVAFITRPKIKADKTSFSVETGKAVRFDGACQDITRNSIEPPADKDAASLVMFHWDFGAAKVTDSRKLHPDPVIFQVAGEYEVSFDCTNQYGRTSAPAKLAVTVTGRGVNRPPPSDTSGGEKPAKKPPASSSGWDYGRSGGCTVGGGPTGLALLLAMVGGGMFLRRRRH